MADNPLILPDGAPFSCYMMLEDDPPRCWTRCEHNATTWIDPDDVEAFLAWLGEHKRSPLLMYPRSAANVVGMCTSHADLLSECIA